ncbi:MAG: Cna B-type domain-containing protein [Coriobacteriaceae bacterium]|nr:Cna B-type domain-containing protein [Coriobacteriaceae bacterium]
MGDSLNGQRNMAAARHRRNERRGLLAFLACVVAMATAFALMAPAISMTKGDLDTPETAGSSVAVQEAEGADGQTSEDADGEAEQESSAESDAAADDEDAAGADAQAAEQEEDPAEAEDEPAAEGNGNAQDETADAPADVAADMKDADTPMPEQSFYGELLNKNDEVTLAVDVEAPEGALPVGTTMHVEAVKAKTIRDAVDEAVAAEEAGEVDSIQAVDITFEDADGQEVQPAVPVAVTFTSPKIAKATEAEKRPLVVHVDSEGAADVVSPLKEKALKKRGIELADDQLAIDADAFSVYALVYTVDFEYEVDGKTYTFVLPGGEKTTLSELVEKLGILKEAGFEDAQAFLKEVKDVEFSNGKLVKVTQSNGDWLLESLGSFDSEEKLLIFMKNGDVITVKVTDPATQDVSSLLTDVSINATKNADGSYTVYAGQAYGIDLTFKEQPSGTQFDMTNGFYYTLPEGLFDSDALIGKATIELSGGDHAGETVELDYRIEGNNLVFTWPDQTSGAYNQLKEAIYTTFKIHIEAKIEENTTELKFNDDITKNVTVKTDGKADVNKSGTYNPKTNSIDYTVQVTSTGICKNVVVADTISGTALTYNNDAKATSNKNSTLPTPTASSNGFTFTIPQMADGEVVTVKYSAAVNLDALTRNDDGTLGTVTQTGNKVTVTPSNHPGDEDKTSGKDLNNKISYSTISKTSSVGETQENEHATVTWTIKANANANVSMAGHTISDLIDPGSQSIMKYSGTGITVVRKNANGTVVGTETIPWSSLTSHTDSAWTWTVPNSSPDTGKLSYEITYTTDVDANGLLFNTTVKNTGTSDNAGSSPGSGTVTPPGGALTARKAYIGKDMTGDEKTVTWEVNFDVPAAGLDSAVIDDTLPNRWNGSGLDIDDYKDGSITITPDLAFGESYEVKTYTDGANRQHMVVTFYKTVDEHKVPGLSETDGKRKIRVQFKTVLNDDWLEAAQTDANALTHQNNANVILNGQTLGTQASVRIDVTEPEITKSHKSETVNVVNNNQLPAWQFFVTLKGVSDDTFDENGQIVIQDTYNSKYLDWYPHAYESWEKENGQVYGGDSNNKLAKSSTNKVMSKVADGELKIVLNQSDLPRMDNGDYYPLYTIPYYLTVKDPLALQKLIAQASYAAPGAIDLYNTASSEVFGTAEDKVSYEVPVVSKSATDPTLQNGVYKLHYTVKVNERALQLGDSDELIMTDEYSNISIDYTTLKIYECVKDQWGNVTRTLVNDVVWDRSGYTSTYYLKNATYYEIEYDAHLSGEGEKINDHQSNLTYTNTAEVFGKKSTWEKTKTIETSNSGGSRTFRVKVLKHVKGNASQGLQGAVFELWWYPSSKDDPNGKDSRPASDDAGWQKVTLDDGTVATLTTDANGYAQTQDGMHIHSQTWYKLVEVTPPAGYTLKTTHYTFWITEGHVADYSKYVYLNDDVLAINNTPELPETVDVSVQKVWDDNSDTTLRRDVNVHLYADGQPYNEYFSGEWAANARDDADVTLHLNADGTSESHTWRGLPSGYTYSVVEDPVPGYTTVYSPKNTLTSGTLRITNKRNTQKTAISIDKVWSDGTKPADDVTIQLKRNIYANAPIVIQNGASNAGATGAHITDYSVPAGATVNLIWTYKNSWGYDSPALNIYNYGTKELIQHIDKASGNPTQHMQSVTVPPEGIIVSFEEPYLSSLDGFTNAFDFDVQVTSTGSGAASEDVNFTNERHYLTLSADKNWHLDVDGLLISDADGAYTYYIEEVGVNDNTQTPEEAGYAVSYTNNGGITNGTITVTNTKDPAKIQVTKAFSGVGALPDGFRITNDYNDDVFTVANKTSGSGTAADPYVWLIDDVPDGTEVEFTETGVSVDGYTLAITANGAAQPEGSTVASASGAAAKVSNGGQIPTVSFVNEYAQDTPQTGSLKIQKIGKVNSADPTEANKAKIDGDYEFAIAGKAGTETAGKTATVKITLANGVATAVAKVGESNPTDVEASIANGVVTLTGLPAGAYTVAENLTDAQRTAGIRLLSSENMELTVTAGDTAGIPTATFVNDYDTTNLRVVKSWTDNQTDITEVSYTLRRYPQVKDADGAVTTEYEPEEIPQIESYGYTGTLKSNTTPAWTEELSGLPANGVYTLQDGTKVDVAYRYYVSEGNVPNYKSTTRATTDGDTTTVTITNTPYSSFDDNSASVKVSKTWKDSDGNLTDEHDNDTVTIQLTQNKYPAQMRVSGQLKQMWPVRVTLVNDDGSESGLSQTLYVPDGSRFTVRAYSHSLFGYVRGNGFDDNVERQMSGTFGISQVKGPKDVSLTLRSLSDNNVWAKSIPAFGQDGYFRTWTATYSNTAYTYSDFTSQLVTSETPIKTTYDYTMSLDADKTGTVLTKGENAIGTTSSTGKWAGQITELPYLTLEDGVFYVNTYEVTEIKIGSETVSTENPPETYNGQTDNFNVKWEQNASTGTWEITNQEKPNITVNIVKIDEDTRSAATPTRLAGAKFKLYKYDGSKYAVYPDEATCEQEVVSDGDHKGELTFDHLPNGQYKIEETKSPDGYVKTEANDIYFEVADQKVYWCSLDGSGNLQRIASEDLPGHNQDSPTTCEYEQNGKSATFTVGNTPGSELPHTGGEGTFAFYMLGIMLTAFAIYLLVRQKRKGNKR